MSKDYYKILGVDKGTTKEEIKKSFRKLAHEYHPDKKTGNEDKFKEINEAYQVLGDDNKRKQYDQYGADFEQQGGFGGGMNWNDFMNKARSGDFENFSSQGGSTWSEDGIDLGDIFGDIFGFGGGRSRGRSRTMRGNDIQVSVELEFREAIFGVEKEIRLTKNNVCSVCSGSGAESGAGTETCSDCRGQGQIKRVQQTILGAMQSVVTCQRCQGSGQIPKKVCKHCSGKGVVHSDSKYKVKIPAGISDGEMIRLSEKGESAGVGSNPGDLYVRVHVKSENGFERQGFDIFTAINISYPQAVLGDKVEINTLEGKKNLIIPEGTISGQKFKLKGLGVPRLQRSGKGDQYVTVIIDVPKKISKKVKKILEELKGEL
ncbi:MAG: molecular chaperone DnaJ [Candidatus Magasanikbacteria bacterium CG1_02_32_51]|uniref:Chaperone protein DnaJ n=1 Tax=Candidatus Magasanikbacteria bacterium CG1_02_32_51 TaxID=1805238 RepID=A0A1J4U9Y7_9BACT|nr:MAG: molecular chaperone DnaJ [Candidatus Magasanikbacteria bacterium CG1_02_32_51]